MIQYLCPSILCSINRIRQEVLTTCVSINWKFWSKDLKNCNFFIWDLISCTLYQTALSGEVCKLKRLKRCLDGQPNIYVCMCCLPASLSRSVSLSLSLLLSLSICLNSIQTQAHSRQLFRFEYLCTLRVQSVRCE